MVEFSSLWNTTKNSRILANEERSKPQNTSKGSKPQNIRFFTSLQNIPLWIEMTADGAAKNKERYVQIIKR